MKYILAAFAVSSVGFANAEPLTRADINFPEADTLDETTLAIQLLNKIHNGITARVLSGPPQTTAPPTNWTDGRSLWLEYTQHPDLYSGICGNYQAVGMHVFNAYGFKVRLVGMFEAVSTATDYDGGSIDSHTAIEVLVNGKWVAMDPTFNVYFQDGDNAYLSYREVRDLAMNGGVWKPVPAGPQQITLLGYRETMDNLTRFMAIDGQALGGWDCISNGGYRYCEAQKINTRKYHEAWDELDAR